MKKLMVTVTMLALLLLLASSPSTAWDEDYHVKQAPNNNGDLLIMPFYAALSAGYHTKLTVVNTSNKYSQVAKVVIKSRDWSQELIDFLIYLSPNDMWTGYLEYKPNPSEGRAPVIIHSTDDSVITSLAAPATVVEADFATPDNPFTFNLFAPRCPGDTARYGYVEIIGSRSGYCNDGSPDSDLLCGQVVPKANIYKWYHGAEATDPFSVVPGNDLNGPRNVMAGWLELARPSHKFSAAIRAETFADWHNLAPLTVVDLSGIDNVAASTIAELEAAMSRSNIAMPYLNDRPNKAFHLFNFPTKNSLLENSTACLPGDGIGYVGWEQSPYFKNQKLCERIFTTTYDMKENTPRTTGDPISGGEEDFREICREVQYYDTSKFDIPYTEGWIRWNFERTAREKEGAIRGRTESVINYFGTPVLPSVLTVNNGGMSWMKAAHDDGSVKIDGIEMLYYQYSDLSGGERPDPPFNPRQ